MVFFSVTEIGSIELFFLWFGVVFAISGLSNQLNRNGGSDRKYYRRLVRPAWAPKNPAIFGIVWSMLYTLQALAVTRIRLFGPWVSGVNLTALVLFVVLQFVLASYTLFFFGFRRLGLSAFAVFAALVLAIVETVLAFRLDILSGIIFILLDLWILFAQVLSISIWYLNNAADMVRNEASRQVRP